MSNEFEMVCPNCGDTDSIDVLATVWVRLTEDGTDTDETDPCNSSYEWTDESPAQCGVCVHAGTVATFTATEQP